MMGNVIAKFHNLNSVKSVVPHTRLVSLPNFILSSSPTIEVPCVGGEDQFLHDRLALVSKYAYTTRVLSTWNGCVENQVTSRKRIPIAAQYFGIYEIISRIDLGQNELAFVFKYLKRIIASVLLNYEDSRQANWRGFFNAYFNNNPWNCCSRKIFLLLIFLELLKIRFVTSMRKLFQSLASFIRYCGFFPN